MRRYMEYAEFENASILHEELRSWENVSDSAVRNSGR